MADQPTAMVTKGRAARLAGHRWKKGQSGNPGGKPGGVCKLIKERCGQSYEKLVEGYYIIAFAPPKERERFFGEKVSVSTRDRLQAITELRDMSIGRPLQTMRVEDDAAPRGPAIIVQMPVLPSLPTARTSSTVPIDHAPAATLPPAVTEEMT